ncbi:PilZ domain-containing protein [Paenibacillus sp. TAB 01]|uniref:PilZ domain-containing protein n=1 Tax=Paenibacillus sp. TAB 01 TaxID=3368988 RepID=UPI003753E214
MNWNQVLAFEMVAPRMSCSLIIVGETKEGTPFCYEDQFTLQKVEEEHLVVSLEFHTMNPLEKLHHVCFIEFSFRERGILYYAFVDLLQLENKRNVIYLKLSAPQELSVFQNRRFQRLHLPSRTPLTCRIVGIRKSSTHQGIAFTGHIQDISAGGLSFVTNTRIFYPLYLELSFVLPGPSPQVCRARGDCQGIQFQQRFVPYCRRIPRYAGKPDASNRRILLPTNSVGGKSFEV